MTPSRRLSLVRLAAAGLHHSGALAPLTRAVGHVRRTPAFPILSYHRVNDDADPFFRALPTAVFERQMRHVARNYRVLPVDGVAISRRHGLGRIVNSALLGAFARVLGAPDLDLLLRTIADAAPKLPDENVAACKDGYACVDAELQGLAA